MIRVLLINPNTSAATTDRMVALAQAAAPPGVQVVGATAAHGPAMILHPAALAAAGAEVTRIGRDFAGSVAGMGGRRVRRSRPAGVAHGQQRTRRGPSPNPPCSRPPAADGASASPP